MDHDWTFEFSIFSFRKKKHARENKKKLNDRLGNKAAGLNDDTIEMDLFSLKTIETKQVQSAMSVLEIQTPVCQIIW